MADPAPSTLAPVRGAAPPPAPAPPVGAPRRRRTRPARPPAPSLLALAVLAMLALGGFAILGWSMVPRPHGGLLHAPVARALEGACVTSPSLCRSRVRSP